MSVVVFPWAGVVLPPSMAMPVVTTDALSLAIGTIPGWRIIGDPTYASGSEMINRAQKGQQMSTNAPLVFGSISGLPAIDVTAAPRISPPIDLNPNEWSFFFILQTPRLGAAGGRELIRGNTTSDTAGPVGPRVTIRTGGQLAIIGQVSTDIRVNGPVIPDNIPFLALATFSVQEGCKLFINDTLVAANPEDTRPLTAEYHAGEYGILRSSSSGLPLLAGVFGVSDSDLGKAVNAGYRRVLMQAMMQMYGIV